MLLWTRLPFLSCFTISDPHCSQWKGRQLLQGDHSGRFKPPVDNQNKGCVYIGLILKHNSCLDVKRRFEPTSMVTLYIASRNVSTSNSSGMCLSRQTDELADHDVLNLVVDLWHHAGCEKRDENLTPPTAAVVADAAVTCFVRALPCMTSTRFCDFFAPSPLLLSKMYPYFCTQLVLICM